MCLFLHLGSFEASNIERHAEEENIQHSIMSYRYLNALSCDTNVSHVMWNMLFARVANFYSSHHPFFHCQCKDKVIDCDFDQRGQSQEAKTLLFDLAFVTPFSLLHELSFLFQILIPNHLCMFLAVGIMNSEDSSLVRLCVNFYSS